MKFNYDDYVMVDKMVQKCVEERDMAKMSYFMDIRSDIYMQLDENQTKRVNWYIDVQLGDKKVGV